MAARPVKKSLTISRHRTSISLEEPFWEALCEIAKERNLPIAGIVTEIDAERKNAGLSSAIRLYILDYFRRKDG